MSASSIFWGMPAAGDRISGMESIDRVGNSDETPSRVWRDVLLLYFPIAVLSILLFDARSENKELREKLLEAVSQPRVGPFEAARPAEIVVNVRQSDLPDDTRCIATVHDAGMLSRDH